MFGYIKPYVPELKVREHELYRALYCGLCKSMGRHAGRFSRFTLSYDFVFLAAIRMALDKTSIQTTSCRCMAHPLKKRSMAEDNPALAYCGAVAATLIAHKVRDDLHDEKGFSRLQALLLLPFAVRMAKKAAIPEELNHTIAASLRRLSTLEKASCPSLDEPADCFGELLSAVCAYGLEGAPNRIAAEIGRCIGRFIYVLDAADDIEKDRKTGSYNPLLLFPIPAASLSVAARLELEKLAAAVNLIDLTGRCDLAGIINNITYLGMPKEADKVFSGDERK